MSAYLEAVAQARDRRVDAEAEFRAAIALAAQHHSLREIAAAANLSHSGVKWLLDHKDGPHARD